MTRAVGQASQVNGQLGAPLLAIDSTWNLLGAQPRAFEQIATPPFNRLNTTESVSVDGDDETDGLDSAMMLDRVFTDFDFLLDELSVR